MSSECEGKSSWPELVGVQGEVAKEIIERENPNVTAQIVEEGTRVDQQYICTRVWVWVNTAGVVIEVPRIG